MNLPGRTNARLKLALGSLFLPLFGLASGAQQTTIKLGDAMLTRRALWVKTNRSAGKMSAFAHLMQITELARGKARLRQLVGWQQQSQWKLKLGNVVLREPANWWRSVQIDLGSRDG